MLKIITIWGIHQRVLVTTFIVSCYYAYQERKLLINSNQASNAERKSILDYMDGQFEVMKDYKTTIATKGHAHPSKAFYMISWGSTISWQGHPQKVI